MPIILNKYVFPCKNNPKCDPRNWWQAFLGKYRNYIFYSKGLGWLMRTFIREQIKWRIVQMDIVCFKKGSCKICGCETPALQMANKACPKPCYPKMMGRKEWKTYKKNNNIK